MSLPLEARRCPRSARAAARGSARASTCRSRTRRRGRASRPRCTSKDDAVDGLHAGDLALQHAAALDREVLVDVARLEQHLAAHAEQLRVRSSRRARAQLLGDGQVAAVAMRRAQRAARAPAARRQQALERVRAARREARSPAAARAATAAGRGSSCRRCGRGRSRRGIEPSRPQVYGCCAFAKSSPFGPSSTIRPAYITQHAVGDLGDDAHVVRDQHDRRAEVACAACGSARGSAPGS